MTLGLIQKYYFGEGTYTYYDTPDGKDIFKKLWYTTKISGGVAFLVASYDVLLHTRYRTPLPIAGRFAHFFLGYIGTSAAWTIGVYASTRLREKDDEYNYVWGGIAGACACGLWQKSVLGTVLGSVIAAIIGAGVKNSKLDNYKLFTAPEYRYKFPFDESKWTLYKQEKVYWKTSEDE